MTQSMTALASRTGGADAISWSIELRSVNAKGLDIRMRVPDALTAQEADLRGRLQKKLARGSVNVLVRTELADDATALALDKTALEHIAQAAVATRSLAETHGLELRPTSAAELLALPGVLRRSDMSDVAFPLAAFQADFDDTLTALLEMRAREGAALADILSGQVDALEALIARAETAAEARRPKSEQAFRDALQKVRDFADGVDEGRIAQELAVLATKSDVTEELDRLRAHIAAARDLLAETAPVGRRLDFLMQEFNREANTLCSKSGDSTLTAIGLDLKATIEQMREQVQNVE